MKQNIFNIENLVQSLFSTLLFGGIIACGIFKDTPNLVEIASLLALTGWLGEKGFHYFHRSATSKLSSDEATDLSFLRQIRSKLMRKEVVDDELMSVSILASNDSDEQYKKVHGFGRPLPATYSGQKQGERTDSPSLT